MLHGTGNDRKDGLFVFRDDVLQVTGWGVKTVLTACLEGMEGHLVELLSNLGNFSGICSVLFAIGKVRDFEDS